MFLDRSVSVIAIFIAASFASAQDGFRPLFNGENFDGWKRISTDQRTWSIEDKMLVCSGKPIGELRTTRMYQNFIMEVEWRHMKPKGNAGIFIWADDITAKGQPFHRGIEVQVLENAYGNNRSHTTHGDIFPIHGAKMVPINGHGGSRAFPTEERSKPSPEWNHYRIEAIDGQISLAVNGKVVTRGRECNPRKGYICIESEGGIVHYRNMKIKELPDTPVDASMVAVADRGYRCLYTGIDLTGWKTEHPGWKANDWRLAFGGNDNADSGVIETLEKFDGDFGFVFDVRLQGEASTCVVTLGKQAAIGFDGKVLATHKTGKSGKWHRFEGTINAGALSLTMDGQVWDAAKKSPQEPTGSIRLKAVGPVEFANIFVRPL